MSDLAKAVTADAVQKLESLAEYAKTMAKQAGEIVDRAREQLVAATEASEIGASKTFLGASVMLVGVTEYPIGDPQGRPYARDVALNFDGNMHRINLHGEVESLAKVKGRYKAIVLLFKLGD